jgi:N-methylhydantoinase A
MSAQARSGSPSFDLGVDVGGTFTDAVLSGDGRLVTAKVPTTPAEESRGVLAAIAQVLERAGVQPQDVRHFGHGMTVATNALLEERGARTALLATEGFADVIEIGRQARPELYRPCAARPAPLVPPELRVEVPERMGPDGVLQALVDEDLATVVERVRATGAESVAISLLHSYAHPEHEQRTAAAVRAAVSGVHVSASHEVAGVFREYERTSTTVVDAYLTPLLARYLSSLAEGATRAGLPEPQIMRSSGGLMSADAAARNAAWTVLSGPAAGAVGAAQVGRSHGTENVLSFDMGGTSCDVAVIDGGRARLAGRQEIAGRVLALPMVDVHTVGAGGGSLGWADPGGALRVGPRSAGAQPGPACYGRGGTEPAVTDANLVLGYLGAESVLAGEVQLDREAAEAALGRLGDSLGLSVEEAAWGMARVADQEMVRAVRLVTVERGIDPRAYALVAFGGAGPMHALRIADELGITRVLCPRGAGVLSALGLVTAEHRRDVERSVLLDEPQLRDGAGARHLDELSAQLLRDLPGARIETAYDLRYRGQAHELTVEAPAGAPVELLRERFEQAHAERYGYADPTGELELVNVRVAALAPRADSPQDLVPPGGQAAATSPPRCSSRPARFGGGWAETAVLSGELGEGMRVEGPAVCELPETTVVVPPEWRGSADGGGTLVLERAR